MIVSNWYLEERTSDEELVFIYHEQRSFNNYKAKEDSIKLYKHTERSKISHSYEPLPLELITELEVYRERDKKLL